MAKRPYIEGVPVSEGVQLEAGRYTVLAVRKADKDIAVRMRREPRGSVHSAMRVPFLRGAVRLVRSVTRFFDGLAESAELRPQRIVRGTAFERGLARLLHVHPQSIVTLVSALCLLLIALVFLVAAPLGAEILLEARFDLSRPWVNGITAGVRALGFLFAVALSIRLRVFNRLLMYRCALNKTLNCYACRDALSAENAARYPRIAHRSDAAFLISVMIVSLLLFPILRVDNLFLSLLLRILVIVGVASVLNEPFSAVENARINLFTRILRTPIDLLQHMTTLEPHPQMLELTVCAVRAAVGELDEEGPEDGEI